MKKIIESLIKGYEDRFGSAAISITFVFVALVPSVILFYGLNSTANVNVTGTGYAVSFGGAAALFIALYWVMLDTHKKISRVTEKVSVRGIVYLDDNVQPGVTVLAEGDNRSVITSYTGSFELELNSHQTTWIVVAQYQDLSVKKQIESNQLSVPLRLELKKK